MKDGVDYLLKTQNLNLGKTLHVIFDKLIKSAYASITTER
jgi:hypothetical protein